MIRRNVLQGERDSRVVKWSLIAAVFALSIGCYAELVLASHEDEAVPAVQTVQKQNTPAPTALAS